jgi:hypothetical protein
MNGYKVDNLTTFEKELLLYWFFYQMSMEQRYDMMENFPMIYFKLTGVKAKIWKETEEK